MRSATRVMKSRTSLFVWTASIVAGLLVYVFTAAPVWVLMRNSDSVLAKVAQRIYSPMDYLQQHSEPANVFFQQQWHYWVTILG